jgi:uncharacterized protein (DUF924 family)
VTIATPDDVLSFWRSAGPKKWFAKDDAFDAEISERFRATYDAAARGALSDWEATPEGALALLIVLDQFPRNMFREDGQTFDTDAMARDIADRALGRGFDQQLAPADRPFFYLPFEHSEAMADQERSLTLFRALGDAESLRWAELHADIIRRFGRFPHRNAVLGRATTPEEQAFLDSGGFSG